MTATVKPRHPLLICSELYVVEIAKFNGSDSLNPANSNAGDSLVRRALQLKILDVYLGERKIGDQFSYDALSYEITFGSDRPTTPWDNCCFGYDYGAEILGRRFLFAPGDHLAWE